MAPDEAVTDREFHLNGLRFHYRDWSGPSPRAPGLVLLHGITSNARALDFLAQSLSESFRVISLDQRGHGESAWSPDGDYHQRTLASDLESLVEALSLSRYSILGYSMGSLAAYTFASARPPGLERLVLVEPGVERDDASEELLSWLKRNAAEGHATPDDAVASALRGIPGADETLVRHSVLSGLQRREDGRWLRRHDPAVFDIRTLSAEQNWELLSSIDVPTLLVHGGRSDNCDSDLAARIARSIGNCSVVEFAECTHGLPLQQPERLLTVVREFLT